MRIAIYDAWLHTLGGGEKHMLTAAVALSELHEVHVHSHIRVSKGMLETATGLSLDNLALCARPNVPDQFLLRQFKQYDLFINATYDSLLPNPCGKGIRLLFFPPPRPNRIAAGAAHALAASARSLGIPQLTLGFYGPERIGRGWFRNSSNTAEITIPRPGRNRLRFMAANASEKPKIVTILAGGREIHSVEIPPTGGDFLPVGPLAVGSIDDRALNLQLEISGSTSTIHSASAEDREIGIAVADPHTDSIIQIPYRLLTQRIFPRFGEEMERISSGAGRAALTSYDSIVANSNFTAEWLWNWWSLPSQVVHPPVDQISLSAQTYLKSPEILSVGRFFIGGHNKNHKVMVQAFSQMVRGGLTGWKLRLIGATGSTAADRSYLSNLRSLADGMPIEIETDVDVTRLHDAYRRASIYWHAAGFGQNERRDPGAFEHFGIAPVEAMSAGAVPIVFDGGGVRESVENGKSGFLWKSESQLQEISWRLIRDADLRQTMAGAALARSKDFSPDKFRRDFSDIVKNLQ